MPSICQEFVMSRQSELRTTLEDGMPCCQQRPDITEATREAARATAERRLAWRRLQDEDMRHLPQLSERLLFGLAERAGSNVLRNAGVNCVPLGFPPDTRPQDLPNYSSIVRAFSRCYGPQLYEEMGQPDPFPSGAPYWSNWFFQVSQYTNPPLMRLNVQQTGSALCSGVTGQYQSGGPMTIYDCTGEEDILHEIGHAIMRDGILRRRSPLYFHYSPGGLQAVGTSPVVVDAVDWLNTWFGKQLDKGKVDVDGVPYGFVSDYAFTSQGEDFADTLKYYVYYSSTLWEKIDRQAQAGSQTLSRKAGLIATLYGGMWFADGGVPAGGGGIML